MSVDDQGRLVSVRGVRFRRRVPNPNAWARETPTWYAHGDAGAGPNGEQLCSYGGQALQACVLVLIFAACVEAQRPTCHACGLWHDDATPCEVHAPGIGELLERATALAGEMRDSDDRWALITRGYLGPVPRIKLDGEG